ncbi:MAG: rod shape-determining protein MreD [Gemmatimonadetes bacterium]|nr:rod shape-determining protein MreD [Gemmatimonadota bacterium]
MTLIRSALFALLLYLVLMVETQPQFHSIAVLGATPDLALIVLCVYGVERGAARASALGFATGLVRDAVAGGTLGVFALVGTIGGYLAGKLGRRIYKRQISTQVLFTVTIAVVVHMLALVLDTGGNLGQVVRSAPLAVGMKAAYTAVLAPPVFRLGILALERKRRMHGR